MRVLHIITRMIVGGAQENTLYNCLDLIQDFGDEVCLVTGPAEGPEGELLKQGRGVSLKIELEPTLLRSIIPWHDWNCYWNLRKQIRNFKPDVVHTHSAKGGFLGRLAAHAEKVPAIIHTVHGAPFHPYQSWMARTLFQSCERYAGKRCDAMVSVADAMTQLMVEANIAPKEKFQTIYSGMEVKPFLTSEQHRTSMRERLGFSETDFVVGKVARLFNLKGHEYLIDAAKQIVAAKPQVKFLLVGDGILRDSLQKKIDELKLTENFVFTGLVPPAEIPMYLSAIDLLVHTSLREGLARTLPQALLSGKPVVSFDIDGAREVCISNQTGFLIPPLNVDKLAAAVIQLAADPELCKQFGEQGRGLCEKRFDHHEMTRQIRTLYEKVLDRKRLAPLPE